MPTLSVTPVDDAEAEVWSLAREVAGLLGGLPWILIGGLMVRITEAEHGVSTEWTTGDVDAVLDIRAMSTATEEASRRLVAAGFEPERDDSWSSASSAATTSSTCSRPTTWANGPG